VEGASGSVYGQHVNEQTRARYPDSSGHVEREGVRIAYDVYGRGEPTVVLLPTWSVIHARHWKAQIPYLARHARVVTFDGRGNGGSDRPSSVEAYLDDEYVRDAISVMDHTDTADALLVGLSCGAAWAIQLAAEHPERVRGLAAIAPSVGLAPGHPERAIVARFLEELETDEDWAKHNLHYMRRDYEGFLRFFFARMFTEPHSTKQVEDCVGWALETDAEALGYSYVARGLCRSEGTRDLLRRVRCPVLVLHGDRDAIRPHTEGVALADASGGRLITLAGSGHGPHARSPVPVNEALRGFLEDTSGRPTLDPTAHHENGRRRALFISSPIGLGHARRDVAIAQELRRLVPDLEVDWLAQDPVTRVLEREGERVHPMSRHLASESGHWESESAEHDLHCFQAWRRMDEILCANYMVFHDLVREQRYDLWVGDEAWEIDYYLHEHPSEKRAPYAWLTDFVGWLPMEDGGAHEELLTADYNAEMIEHIAEHPDVRDRALFVGDPDDIVSDRLGPDLPLIRDWTERNFDFSGYVTGFDPAEFGDRERLRAELGYRPREQVCIVSVGGSGVGESLLRKVIAAYPAAREAVPDLRMIVVAGPRIDPASLPAADGLQVCRYVHDLYRHLAACDLAVVQGGLTTAMELTANRRPFVYFPLAHHFEQNFHVRHRLERYGAGRCMSFAESEPADIAAAIADEIGRDVDYRAVETSGARRAAERIAELLE
jgi:pimeloyl-ACP methyl ester carboxylesterase/predicted glycosyltransferase